MDGTQAPFDRLGSYRIVRRIATGGTSDVLLAKAEGPFGFERQVVLKILLSQYRADDQFARMFAREAAAYARLSHASVVRLFDFFSHGDQLVMVLEFVDGLPLNRLRATLKDMGKTLPDTAALYVASHVFEALASAHDYIDPSGKAAPVIHRDVNPSNVLVGWNGDVKLADFGIARVTGVRADTQNGLIQGTFGYMAPEQVTGADIGTHTDVYAAGLLLWEMLAHRKAIQRGVLPEIEILRAMADPHLVSLDVLRPDLHGRVREVVARTLEPDPRKRTITAEEAWSLLRDVIGPRGGRAELFEMAKLIHERATVKVRSAEPVEPPLSVGEQEASPRPPTIRAPALTGVTTSGPVSPVRPVVGPSSVGRLEAREGPRLDELDPIDIDKLFDGISLPDDEPEPPSGGDDVTIASTAPPTFDVEALLTESRRAGVGSPGGVPAVRVATPTQMSAVPARPQIRPSRKMTAISTTVAVERRASQELTAVARVEVEAGAQRHPSGDTTLVSRGQFPPPAGLPQGLTPRPPEVGPISVSIPSVKSTLIMPVADMRTSAPPPEPSPSPLPPPVGAAKGLGATPAGPAVAPRPPVGAAPPTARGLPPPLSAEAPPPPAPLASASGSGPAGGTPPPPAATPAPPPVVKTAPLAALPMADTAPLAALPVANVAPLAALPVANVAPLAALPMADTAPLAALPVVEVPVAPPPDVAPRPAEPAPVGPADEPPEEAPIAPPPPFFTPARVLAVILVTALSAAGGVAYVRSGSARSRAVASASAIPSTTAPPSAIPSASAPASAEPSASSSSAAPEASASAPLAPSVAPSASTAPSSVASAAVPAASAEAPKAAVPANMCLLKTTGASPGHRVYVDGRVVVETPGEARVPCGSRTVQLGSAGKPRTLDLPCGAEHLVK
ncbi:MAG: serine/threonine protein kinase [Myxococcales bacterium]|nr:serine/threonine protein kinase [Myxococcales bacterium]